MRGWRERVGRKGRGMGRESGFGCGVGALGIIRMRDRGFGNLCGLMGFFT